MIKKNIIFVSFDEEYVSTIEYKFAKLIQEKASVEYITDKGIFSRLMKMPKKVDVLIVPYGVVIEHPEAFSKATIHYLTEDETLGENPSYIYKYSSVKSIVEQIDSSLIVENASVDVKGTKVIAVTSVAGGVGTTLTALTLSNKLKQKGKRVMYISTVPHQDFSYYMKSDNVLGTAFCYQCSINTKNALKLLMEEIRTEDFDYLPQFKNLPVSYQMMFSTYSQIVEYLKSKNTYDYIVVELSPELQAEKLVFLKEADRTVIVTTQDKICVGRLETFLNHMVDFSNNIVILCNRYNPNHMDYLSGGDILRNYEFSEFIEEYTTVLDYDSVKNSLLFDKTVICIE